MAAKVITRAEAKAAGLTRYFTGASCARSHVAERSVTSKRCLLCMRETQHARRKLPHVKAQRRVAENARRVRHRSRLLELERQRRLRNRESIRAQSRESGRRKRQAPLPTRPPTARCECCARPAKTTLHLDHCHTTGLFRGWLCARCNLGIGLLGDTMEGVTRATLYLAGAA